MLAPLPLTPYINYVTRNLFGNLPLKTVADRQEVLCQDETIKVPPAIFLSGQLDRVTASDAGTTIELEISAATSELLRPFPTIAHHLTDVIVVDGSIYKGRFKSFISARSFFKTCTPHAEPLHLKTIGLASSHLGSRFFGHWLIDDCTQYRMAEQHGRPLCIRGPVFPSHQQTYQTYLGQDWTPINRAWIDRLIVYQDFYWGTAQDSLRGAHIRSMRQRARAMLPSGRGQSLVYLRRGTSGVRRPVQNEAELLDVLTRYGFSVVDLDSGSLEQLLGILANAKIVVSMEGSQATHCAYALPENSGLILLEPPDRFLSFHRGWTASAGVGFGFVVGSSGEGGYTFSPSEVLRTVDLMMKAMAHRSLA
jgi:Glycosyltransferase 61